MEVRGLDLTGMSVLAATHTDTPADSQCRGGSSNTKISTPASPGSQTAPNNVCVGGRVKIFSPRGPGGSHRLTVISPTETVRRRRPGAAGQSDYWLDYDNKSGLRGARRNTEAQGEEGK